VDKKRCSVCSTDESGVWRLLKCPMCFKIVCENCAVRHFGKYFCSNVCATNFFVYTEDE
jgi:hypothetical protein